MPVAELAQPRAVPSGGTRQPPAFCTGSSTTAATVFGPSATIIRSIAATVESSQAASSDAVG